MSKITVENFTKTIKHNTVLDNINVTFESGRIYGLVGINGSGKTMLLRAISGLITGTSGFVTVDGVRVGNGKHPRNVGLLIENADLWPYLSAYECLDILNTMSEKKITKDEIKAIISEFDLDPESKKPFKAFSLGMKQKLRLAQVFMSDPDLIILDEPTNALDEGSIERLRERILNERAKGKTVLLASHSSEDVRLLCDEIIYMNEGKITGREIIEKNE